MISNIQELKEQIVLADLLLILLENQSTHMSTLALRECGISSPAAGIARLKEEDGLFIETIYQSIIDKSGARKRMACYKIVGAVSK
jgi:hypothetical protein